MVDPFEVATIYAFRQRPESFYQWVHPFVDTILSAEPNAAHYALADLGAMGIIRAIITQNIDGLHQKANSHDVYEVHGHLRSATCIHCYKKYPASPLIAALRETGEVPRCTACGGVIKPDIILYGEQLPARQIVSARQAAARSDVMLVVGSSLEVAPSCDLPLLTKRNEGKLIIINLGETALDGVADVVIRRDVADALPRLTETVRSLLDKVNRE
jgi:NAD-dependent deacetylase